MPNLEYLTSGSPGLRRKFAAVVDACKMIPMAGANITEDMTPKGKVFNAILSGANGGFTFPFELKKRARPGDKTGMLFDVMVNPDSTVMKSLKPNDNLTCTGLGVWIPLIANDVIAAFMVIANYIPISATIQSYGLGTTTFDPTLAAWNSGDNSYVYDDGATPPAAPKQIGANILIGYSTPDSKGKPFLIQAQRDHILMENSQLDGFPAVFDFSHRERYGITAP